MELALPLPVLVMNAGASGVINQSGLALASLGCGAANVPGWVSGSIASLGSNASATVIFDLGPDWAMYGLLQITVTGTAAMTSITERAGDAANADAQDLIATSGVPLVLTLSGAGSAQGVAMVAGRFVRIAITNGATAQGAGAGVRLVAMPA